MTEKSVYRVASLKIERERGEIHVNLTVLSGLGFEINLK